MLLVPDREIIRSVTAAEFEQVIDAVPKMNQLYIRTANTDADKAARRAVFDTLVPHTPKPIKQIQGILALNKRHAKNMIRAYKNNEMGLTNNHDLQLLAVQDGVEICMCRPAGAYVRFRDIRRKPIWEPKDDKDYWRWLCDRKKVCPWCFYDHFVQVFNEIYALGRKRVFTFQATFTGSSDEVWAMRARLAQRLRRNRPDASFWLFLRPDLLSSDCWDQKRWTFGGIIECAKPFDLNVDLDNAVWDKFDIRCATTAANEHLPILYAYPSILYNEYELGIIRYPFYRITMHNKRPVISYQKGRYGTRQRTISRKRQKRSTKSKATKVTR